MLTQCWPTICDAGPASNQHWFNASCLLGCVQPSKPKTFVQCWANVEDVVPTLHKCYTNVVFAGNSSCSANMIHWTNAGLLLGRRRRRRPTLTQLWVNVSYLLGGLVLLAAYCWPRLQADTDLMSVNCRASVVGAGQYPVCPSQYFILPYLHAGGIVQSRCFEPKLG